MTNERLLRQATICSNIITHPLQHALSYQIHSIFFLSQTLRPEMIEPWVFYPKYPHYITSHRPFIHRWNSHQGQRHLNKRLQPQPEIEPSSSGPTLPPEPQPTFFICFDVETGESLSQTVVTMLSTSYRPKYKDMQLQ